MMANNEVIIYYDKDYHRDIHEEDVKNLPTPALESVGEPHVTAKTWLVILVSV